MLVDQLAESLDAGHHAESDIIAAKHLPVDLGDHHPRGAGQSAEQAAVIAAVDPLALGNSEDELPVGNPRRDGVGDLSYNKNHHQPNTSSPDLGSSSFTECRFDFCHRHCKYWLSS